MGLKYDCNKYIHHRDKGEIIQIQSLINWVVGAWCLEYWNGKSFHIEFIPQTDCGWSKLHLCFWVLWIPECYTHVSSHSTTGYTYKRYAPTLSLATENISTRLVHNHGAQIWQAVVQKDIEITLKASSSVRSSPIYTGSTSFGFAIPAICTPLAFRHVLFYLFVPLPRLPSSLPCQVMNCMCRK